MMEENNKKSNDEKINNLIKKIDNLAKMVVAMFILLVLIMSGITLLQQYMYMKEYNDIGVIDETWTYVDEYIKTDKTIEAIDDKHSLVKVNISNTAEKPLMINYSYLAIIKITCNNNGCNHEDINLWCGDEKMTIYYLDEEKSDSGELMSEIELKAGETITLEFEVENKYTDANEYALVYEIMDAMLMN